jgi:hypothetical protein
VSGVPARLLDAVRDVLARHADDLGIDRATVKRLAAPAVTARTQDGGLLRLDVSAYDATELTR